MHSAIVCSTTHCLVCPTATRTWQGGVTLGIKAVAPGASSGGGRDRVSKGQQQVYRVIPSTQLQSDADAEGGDRATAATAATATAHSACVGTALLLLLLWEPRYCCYCCGNRATAATAVGTALLLLLLLAHVYR